MRDISKIVDVVINLLEQSVYPSISIKDIEYDRELFSIVYP